MPKNKITDLRNHLFAQLERLGDESIKDQDLEKEVITFENRMRDAISTNDTTHISVMETKLLDFQRYFNGHRAHAGLHRLLLAVGARGVVRDGPARGDGRRERPGGLRPLG